MSPYHACRSLYHGLVPESTRQWVRKWFPPGVERARARIVNVLQRTAGHDEIYDAEYYAKDVEPMMAASAARMATSILRDLTPRRVIDVGCGTGALMAALVSRGVQCKGFDYATAALQWCQRRGLEVERLDIENDPTPPGRADLVISTEVAEHLPARCADRFVDHLTRFAPIVVLTAAAPGAGGTDHVNEQPPEYWIGKFTARQFEFNRTLSEQWRQEWRGLGVAECFAATVMVFTR